MSEKSSYWYDSSPVIGTDLTINQRESSVHNGKNFIGAVFGQLTIIKFIKRNSSSRPIYLCKCSCGKEKEINYRNLSKGHTKSCGCLLKNKPKNHLFVDNENIGKKFNLLTILEFKGIKKDKATYLCKCDCGNEKEVRYDALISSSIKSCGCLVSKSLYDRLSLPIGVAAFNKLYNRYKYEATSRGFNFELNKDEFKELTSANCFYCKTLPNTISNSKNGIYTYNGIDRVDSNVGYVEKNVVTCCEQCNRMKLDYSLSEFKNQIIKLYFNFCNNE